MTVLSVLLFTAQAGAAQVAPIQYWCPVMSAPADSHVETFDYKGIRYFGCCTGCAEKFAADPEKYVEAIEGSQHLVGQALYDPVSRMRVKAGGAHPRLQYKGIMYTFENADDLTKFKDAPESFTKTPDKEVLKCPVLDVTNPEPALNPSYYDADGVRIYLCCHGCINPTHFHKDEYTAKAKPLAAKCAVHIVTADDLKKEAEAN